MAYQVVFDKIISSPFALFYSVFYIFCVIFEYNEEDGPIEHAIVTLHNFVNDRVNTKDKIIPLVKFLIKLLDVVHNNEETFITYGNLLIPILVKPTISNILLSTFAIIFLLIVNMSIVYKLIFGSIFTIFILVDVVQEKLFLIVVLGVVYYVSHFQR